RPADARRFELIVNTSPEQIREIGHTEVDVKLDGIPIGPRQFSGRGWQTARWDLPPAREGVTEVEFHVTPAYRAARDPRLHGLARGKWSLAACRFLLGLGEPGNWPAAAKAVAEWFPMTQRALGVGIFNAGSSMGSALAPPVVAALTLWYGWRTAFLFTGAI